MHDTLDELIALINKGYVFNESVYPLMGKLSESERLLFSLQHALVHVTKTNGKLSTHIENADHGGVLQTQIMKEEAIKQVINALVTTSLLGVSATEILSYVQERFKKI